MSRLRFETMDAHTFVQQLDTTHPLDAFLKQFASTSYPAVFRNEAVLLDIIPSRPWLIIFNSITASGKDTIMDALITNGLGVKAKTATTRVRRPNELENHYVWMRGQRTGEDFETYHKNLIRDYDLLESDVHHGNVYGLPRENLYTAAQYGVVIMQNEPNGAKTLLEKVKDDFNIVVFFIVPDSWEQIFERMTRAHESRDNELTRLHDSVEWLTSSQKVTHYYLHSTEFPEKYGIQDASGLELLINSVTALMDSYV